MFLVDYLFNNGSSPPLFALAKVDGVGILDIADLVYLVDFMFANGPESVCGS